MIQSIFEDIETVCISDILWQAVPLVDHTFWEEVTAQIQAVSVYRGRMSSCPHHSADSKQVTEWYNDWHPKNFQQISTISPLFESP